jgi:cytochrome P450
MINCVPILAGQSPTLWPNPEKFNCERDNLEKVNEIPNFGSGPHHCVGEQFARKEFIIVISEILKHTALQTQEPLPDLINQFTLRPVKDMKMQFKPRSTEHNTNLALNIS